MCSVETNRKDDIFVGGICTLLGVCMCTYTYMCWPEVNTGHLP